MRRPAVQHVVFQGFRIGIENPAGSLRPWSGGQTLMLYPYGFFEGIEGHDGDDLDVYVGPDETAPLAYVVHQRFVPAGDRPPLRFDEDKVFLGFQSPDDAKRAYLQHRDDNLAPFGGMTALPVEELRAILPSLNGWMVKAGPFGALLKGHVDRHVDHPPSSLPEPPAGRSGRAPIGVSRHYAGIHGERSAQLLAVQDALDEARTAGAHPGQILQLETAAGQIGRQRDEAKRLSDLYLGRHHETLDRPAVLGEDEEPVSDQEYEEAVRRVGARPDPRTGRWIATGQVKPSDFDLLERYLTRKVERAGGPERARHLRLLGGIRDLRRYRGAGEAMAREAKPGSDVAPAARARDQRGKP